MKLKRSSADPSPLWAAYQSVRSLDTRNALVVHYQPLIDVVLRSLFRGSIRERSDNYVSLEGLESSGSIGLIRGIEKFDSGRGFKPETYLSTKIRSAVLDDLRAIDPLTRPDRELIKKAEKIESDRYASGEACDDEAIAEELGVDRQKLKIARRGERHAGAMPLSIFEGEDEHALEPWFEEDKNHKERAITEFRRVLSGMSRRDVTAFVLLRCERMSLRDVHASIQGCRWESKKKKGVPLWLRRISKNSGFSPVVSPESRAHPPSDIALRGETR